MLRYAVTSRALYSGDEHEKQAALLRQTSRWIADGIDVIQLREKDLSAAEVATLARSIVKTIELAPSHTKLLINSRCDIAIATCSQGVHLTSAPGELTPSQVRRLYVSAGLGAPVVTVSCHTLDDVARAREQLVDAILFGPVFEKILVDQEAISGQGLNQLHAVCTIALPIPVYALGGVTLENASSCLQAGASGIAGIRLFHRS